MATYCTVAQLREYAGSLGGDLPDDDAECERLLLRAEVQVDELVGPYSDTATPTLVRRKLDPAELSSVQATALSRATCAAAMWEVASGLDPILGGPDYAPSEGVTVMLRPSLTPRQALLELSGTGLIRRSGCVQTAADEGPMAA